MSTSPVQNVSTIISLLLTCMHSQYISVGSVQVPSVPSIVDIVTASSLSNDDIDDLIDQLLDKMKTEVRACVHSNACMLIHTM